MWWLIIVCGPVLVIAVPRFDPTALLNRVLVPADAPVGSVIYRLRASDTDFAYPLTFQLDQQTSIISIETLNCSRLNSLCHANVILQRKLEIGRFYDFKVSVRSSRGARTSLNCNFRATNATTPLGEIFPSAPTLLTVSENSRRNTELGQIIARGNLALERPVFLELWGSPLFGLHQRLVSSRNAEGTIILIGKLDYEKSTVHHLNILANDPWTEPGKDTRNIASWSLLVAVQDEQDTPPVFTIAPPTTVLSPSLRPGDVVLRVHAEDGDKGSPRDIRYDLVPDGGALAPFFNISEDTGEIRLMKPLQELQAKTSNDKPILITVIAEEVRSNPREQPAQSSTVKLALLPPKPAEFKPQFTSNEYSTEIDENSPIGTILDIRDLEVITQPGVVVKIELTGNNGTFEAVPNVIEGRSKFSIKVKDPLLLDYETRKVVHCFVVAKELGDSQDRHPSTAILTVNIKNVNDNPPKFLQNQYNAEILENSDVGSSVVKVEAYDVEKNRTDTIRYTKLSGPNSNWFSLDEKTGWITISDSSQLDSEQTKTIEIYAEAMGDDGSGLPSKVKVTITLLDVNDEVPKFDKNPYEFILNPSRKSFTIPAYVRAIDNDISSPNNDVHYEFIELIDNLTIHDVSGEITVNTIWNKKDAVVYHVRAYDGGVPRLWSECEVKIYPPETSTKKMVFIVTGKNPDRQLLADTLTTIVGGPVSIEDVKPYDGHIESGAIDISRGSDKDRSIVVTTINSASDINLDINRIRRILDSKETEETVVKEGGFGSNWSWLYILLLVLLLLIILILILCCICEPCPLYIPPKKRKVASTDVTKLVIAEKGEGKENKGVQVAEWFGRKEAWSPEAIMVENEVDSLRKHELERGSDREERQVRQQVHLQDHGRDQYYIREGNADILRLITRQGQNAQDQRPITLVNEQPYVVDSGKDILMRRFIDQQQTEAIRGSNFLPNAVSKLHNEQELLEASLRHQNALLRQILIERERDLRLETQSLPAGTQTDHDAGTQTEPMYLRPPKRRTRSDNDASEGSEDDKSYRKRKSRNKVRRHIRTPIQEEPDDGEGYEKQEKRIHYAQTRASILRKKAVDDERKKSLKNEVLREISASLIQSESDTDSNVTYSKRNNSDSEDSFDYTPRSQKSYYSTRIHKYSSEIDLRSASPKKFKDRKKSLSQTDLSQSDASKKKVGRRSQSRYMEWYKKDTKGKVDAKKLGKGSRRNSKSDKSPHRKLSFDKSTTDRSSTDKTTSDKNRIEDISKEKIGASKAKSGDSKRSSKKSKKDVLGPEHPLLQHSEHRYEVQYPPRRLDEDADSGIALTRPPIAEKKSVFTIKYDDIHTSQLRPESATTPPL